MKRLHSDQSQNSPSSAAAEAVASIDDLLLEIFGRLPLKPLVRFKSVSKRWNSVVSDPRLRRLLNQRPNPPVGLIGKTDRFTFVVPFHKSVHIPTLTFPKSSATHWKYPWDVMLHSCNGLLICEGYMGSSMSHFVLNPTTMKCTTLPDPTTKREVKILAMCLAFDPSTSPHYKVVCVTDDQDYRFQVYSSQTRSWRVIPGLMQEASAYKLHIRNGVYWNGAIHWITKDKNLDSLYFNPEDEENHEVLHVFPSPPANTRCAHYFGESCGHLHYVDHSSGIGEMTVYEMRRDYSEWFLKYKFRVDVSNKHIYRVHYLFRAKKEEDCFVVLWDIDERVVRHNILSGTSETMTKLSLFLDSIYMLPYFESICLV